MLAWLQTLPALPSLLAELDLAPQTTWPLLAQLLDVPCGDGYEPPRLTPERQKEVTLQTLARLVVRLARRRPTVFVLEDLHWADPTTAEFLVALVDAARAAHVTTTADRPGLFLLFTARPEFVPPWTAQDVTSALALLARERFALLISDIGMPGRDGYDLIRELRAKGNPIPAIALTAFARAEERSRVLEAGYHLHLAKPVNPVRLAKAVASVRSAPAPADARDAPG